MTTKKSIENPMGFSFRSTLGVAELEALSETSQHLGHALSMTPRQKNNALPKNSTSLEIALAQLTADRLNIDVSDIKITLTAISDKGTGSPYNPPLKENPTRFSTSSSEKLEKVLPFIAWQEHVDVWKEDYSLEQKREIVSTARQVHAQKGTIGALQMALANLGLEAKISEWWEYEAEGAAATNGVGVAQKKLKPHYFKIDVNVSQTGLDGYTDENLSLVIEETKNLRSILDVIQIWLSSKANLFAAAATMVGEHIEILPFIQTNIELQNPNPFIAGAMQALETLTIKPRNTA